MVKRVRKTNKKKQVKIATLYLITATYDNGATSTHLLPTEDEAMKQVDALLKMTGVVSKTPKEYVNRSKVWTRTFVAVKVKLEIKCVTIPE